MPRTGACIAGSTKRSTRRRYRRYQIPRPEGAVEASSSRGLHVKLVSDLRPNQRAYVADFQANGIFEDVNHGRLVGTQSHGVLNYTASATNVLWAAKMLQG